MSKVTMKLSTITSRQGIVPLRPFVAANWKMYLPTKQAIELAKAVRRSTRPPSVDVTICPSYPALVGVGAVLKGTGIALGAQNLATASPGASTGQVSADDLRQLGCQYVIVGHSELRASGETDRQIHQKMLVAMNHHLSPILCVGEHRADRRQRRHQRVVTQQVTRALTNLPRPHRSTKLFIAYEPIWAISPGGPATPADALEMADIIHQTIISIFGKRLAESSIRIIYGGSVDATNVTSFVDRKIISGVLVGAQSISARHLRSIINVLGSK